MTDNPLIYVTDLAAAIPVLWLVFWLLRGVFCLGETNGHVKLTIPSAHCLWGLASVAWIVLRVTEVVS